MWEKRQYSDCSSETEQSLVRYLRMEGAIEQMETKSNNRNGEVVQLLGSLKAEGAGNVAVLSLEFRN